jgi:excisionase family DNA binding protein
MMKTQLSFLTPEQVAELLQINVLTVYSYIHQNKLSAIRLGRSFRIQQTDLDKFIENSRVNNAR